MKKLLFTITAMLLPLLVSAQRSVEIEGIYYNLERRISNEATVTENPSLYSGDLVIPTTVKYDGTTYNVTSIGRNAFSSCRDLTSITIPSSVTSIDDAFSGCHLNYVNITDIESWCKISFSSESSNPLRDASKFLLNGEEIRDLEIPNSVTSIANYVFVNCRSINSVTIPNSVTSIGESAFSGCSGLTSITIPNNLTNIGVRTFSYCSGLTSITIPNSVTSIGESAFSGCRGLTSITIPSGVTSIGSAAFSECSGLTSIVVESGNTQYDSRNECNAIIETESNTLIVGCKNTKIQDGVMIIGDEAFSRCDGLTSVSIPSSVTTIGKQAFYACRDLTSVTIKEGLKIIGNGAFYGCGGLSSIAIPSSVTSIGASALSFTGWYENQPDGVLYLDNCLIEHKGDLSGDLEIVEGTRLIASYALSNCSELTSVTIPESVTSIGSSAFMYCSGLTSVTISDGVTSIGDYAFSQCSGLTSVTIPESVTSIGSSAFSYCSGLASITIPNSVTSIGSHAFYDCNSLTSITIGSGVKTIGDLAFSDCQELKDVYCYAKSVPNTSEIAFIYSTDNAILHVLQTSIDAYKNAVPWSEFKEIVALPDEGKKGDANGDGTVNVADIVEVVNYIMGSPSGKFDATGADASGDGTINAADIVTIVNIIMGQ